MKFDKRYWQDKYNNQQTGWDIGYISTPIKEYIDQLSDKSLHILIPGAGNAYEAAYLYKKGFANVYVLDITHEPIQNFQNRIPDFPETQIIHQDFFEHHGQYDLIIEQTFFCSLHPKQRKDYVNKISQLLKTNGKLVGLLFDIDFNSPNPPFGGNMQLYKDLFAEKFEINILETAYNSIKPRANNELFIRALLKD